MIFVCWQAPDRDSPTITKFSAEVELARQLSLLLQMEGRGGTREAEVREVTGENLSRPRRWHLFFERMGLMFPGGGGLTRLTDLGRLLAHAEADGDRDFRRRLARDAISVLRKYQLKNPADETATDHYPDDCDVHPYWAVWKAANELGGRLHWDELNRELMYVLRRSELDAAIDNIRQARQQHGDTYDPTADGVLRPRCHNEAATQTRTSDDGVRDHITTPWMKRAGFGELLMRSPRSSGQGFWSVPEDMADLIRDAVAEEPAFHQVSNADEWFHYYGTLDGQETHGSEGAAARGPAGAIVPTPLVVDDRILRMIKLAISSAPAVMLVGPPGTGKTSLLAQVLTEISASPESYGFAHTWGAKWVTPEESWTTRDLIGGETVDEQGRLRFRTGAVLEAISEHKWLVLDEANRADMDRIFGGLLTWLAGHDVDLGRVSTNVDAPVVRLGWDQSERGTSTPLGRLNEDDGDSSPIEFRAGREWRLLGTYNALDAQRVFRFGQALGRRFVRIPIPAMSGTDFRTALIPLTMGLPQRVIDGTAIIYEAHRASENAQLGPALFFWLPEYVRHGLRSNGYEDNKDAPNSTDEQNTLNDLIDQLLAEAYLSAAGVWLAKLDDDERERLRVHFEQGGAIPRAQWDWLVELLPALG